MKLTLPCLLLVLTASPRAFADEAIRTGAASATPPPAAAPAPLSTGAAQSASAEPTVEQARPACPRKGDPPHGAVWGGIGTGGYREAGAVVTAPLGHCAAATIAVETVRARWR